VTLTVQLVDTEAGFFAVEAEWNELQERSTNATIFTTFEWARVAWDFRGPGIRPYVLKFYDGPALVGLAPLRLRQVRWQPRLLQHIAMGFPDASLADYLDVLSASGYEQAVIQRMLTFLMEHKNEWDVFDWRSLAAASPSCAPLVAGARRLGLHLLVSRESPSHDVTLPPSWKAFLATLSPNMRSTIERKTRKIVRERDARFEQVCSPEEAERMIQQLFAFQQERWTVADPELRNTFIAFSRQVVPGLLRRGWLDLRVLRAGEAPIAVFWNFRFHGTVYYYLSAFDQAEEWSKYSIGTILLGDTIKHAIEDGFHTFDLMRGDHAYKTRFGGEAHENYRLRIIHSPVHYGYYRSADFLGYVRRKAVQQLRRGRQRVRRRGAQAAPGAAEVDALPPPPVDVAPPAGDAVAAATKAR
jgi:CelD/BcsL family acetyltransferase involved in cellulose biosynthesis